MKEKDYNLELLKFKILYNSNDIDYIWKTLKIKNEYRKDLIEESFIKYLIKPTPYLYCSRSSTYEDGKELIPYIEQEVEKYCKKAEVII